ncbi:hypothetical protein AVEN_153928-1 [Araneus ventricosus]|uniref:Uncharacterized protein n=1 Tax=Araneus ventricosus TaxID=182803 RepID=A0A4Y2F5W0_ARAVE|nr:hypothetical protein AVEN_153928-1 [Araneus ventricosus]
MDTDKEKRKLPGSPYRQVQKKLLFEKKCEKYTEHRIIFKKESATVNLSLNVDTVEVDNEKETPAITSQLSPLKKLSTVQHSLLKNPLL